MLAQISKAQWSVLTRFGKNKVMNNETVIGRGIYYNLAGLIVQFQFLI